MTGDVYFSQLKVGYTFCLKYNVKYNYSNQGFQRLCVSKLRNCNEYEYLSVFFFSQYDEYLLIHLSFRLIIIKGSIFAECSLRIIVSHFNSTLKCEMHI
jgi:hypothetical protein